MPRSISHWLIALFFVSSFWSRPQAAMSQETAPSSNFTVIHTFTGGKDGSYPYAGLVIDEKGNLYGTANQGGNEYGSCPPANDGCGTVFQMAHSKSGWSFRPLYLFLGGNDGQGPYGRVAMGVDGRLYGTTIEGGNQNCPSGCGTVFSLQPPAGCLPGACAWSEAVLYRFQGNSDGFYPAGDLAFDKSGNVYGTTTQGGAVGPGTIYELKNSNGNWAESILYSFTGQNDGGNPYSGVTLGTEGEMYTSALAGGENNGGSVVELGLSKGDWTETTLHDFYPASEGIFPQAGLILEKSGKLIGATTAGGLKNGGTVYELIPSSGRWRLSTLHNFSGVGDPGPWAKLTMDSSGNLYGTTQGYPPSGDWGTVFKLTHSSGGWRETVLHRFTGGDDGGVPYSTVVFDGHGNLYGTTNLGGTDKLGVVFEIATP